MSETVTDQAKDAPTRRSKRLRAKFDKENSQQVPTNDCGSVSVTGGLDDLPVTKRHKAASTPKIPTPRRFLKKGRLEPLVKMPVEIIGEIASNLRPMDLLTLARSCKILRDFFMSRSSAPIWKASRDSIDLPDCPPDLSEPQYADLLFSKGCFLCLAPRAQILRFPFRLRLCKACDVRNLLSLRDVPSTTRARTALISASYYAEQDKFLDLFPYVEEDSCGSPNCKEHRCMYVTQVIDLLDKEKKMSDQEWTIYVEENGPKTEALNKHARDVEDWIERDEKRKNRERNDIAVARRKLIFDRLESMPGSSSQQLLEHPMESQANKKQWKKLMSDPKPLTERIWKNIEPKLYLIMRERAMLIDTYGTADDVANGILDEYYDESYDSDYDDFDYGLHAPSLLWTMLASAAYGPFDVLHQPFDEHWSEDENDGFD